MKDRIIDTVLEFMKEVDTSEMNSNEFIFEMYENYFWKVTNFKNWPSVESITRSRRKVISDYWFWKREKADTEKEYIETFARKNKI